MYEKFGIPIDKQMELDTFTFHRLLRDSICLKYRQTEEGTNYLRDCWRLQQTEPDYNAIDRFNKRNK